MSDMIETARTVQGKIHTDYDMTIVEMNQLHKIYLSEGLFAAMSIAFKYGYVQGHRATISGIYKE